MFPTSPPLLPVALEGHEDPEIDFSPSVGVTPLHTVPSLVGSGVLDWSHSGSDDEKADKRWMLSMSIKRRPREKPQLPPRAILEKQMSEYAGMQIHLGNVQWLH